MKIGLFNLTSSHKEFFQGQLSDHEIVFLDTALNEDNLPEQKDFDIISVFVKSTLTKKVIDYFPDLKMVTLRSTGFDNIDLDYAKEKNIIVCNVPAYGSQTVAEFTFALILSLSRRIPQALAKLKTTKKFDYQDLQGIDLYGKVLGVVGTGKIGVNVIKIAKGIGMKILAFDIYPNEGLAQELDFKYVSLDELLMTSDIITLHTPLTPQTKHLINQENISKMKKTGYLINTARGQLIDTKSLLNALEKKVIAGAALDVLEQENNLTEIELRLLGLENVMVTPHMAFYTVEAEQSIMKTTAENILDFTNGNPKNTV